MSRNRKNTGFRGKKRQRGGAGKKIKKVMKIMKDFETTKNNIIRKIKNGAMKVKKLKKKQFGGLVQPGEDNFRQFGGRLAAPKKYYLK